MQLRLDSDGSDAESERDYYVPGQRNDDADDMDDYDSEEELYPLQHAQPPAREPKRLHVSRGGDEHDDWVAAEARARLRSTVRVLSETTALMGQESAKATFALDLAQLQAQQRAVEQESRLARHARAQRDLDEVSALLEGMTLQREQDDAKLLSEFEARSKAIWDVRHQHSAHD